MKKRSLLFSVSLILSSFAIGQEIAPVAPTAVADGPNAVPTTIIDSAAVVITEASAATSSTPLLQDTVTVENRTIKLDTLVNKENPLDTTILVSTTTSKDMTITPKEDTHVRDGNSEKDEARVYPKVNHWSIAGHAGVAFIDGDQTQLYNDLWPKSRADIAFGFEVEYTFTPAFGLYAEYVYNPYRGSTTYYYLGKKQATDGGYQEHLQEPFDFEGLAHEVNLGVSLNFLNMFYRYRPQKWNVYLNLGMGIAFYNVSAYNPGTKNTMNLVDGWGTVVAPSIPEGRAITFPLGISLEYNPLKWLAVVWNTQYRMHKKDNMDASEKGNDDDNTIYSGLGLRWKINSPKDKTIQHIRNMSPADYEPAQCCDATVENSQKISEIVTQISALAGNASSMEEEKIVEDNLPDTDLDGVPDVRDRHPNTPSGSFVNYYGEPLDKDAVERILGYGQYVEETPSIYFDLGSARLTIESHMVLTKIARKMYADPNFKLDIVGYCDNLGGDELNNKLSMKRAEDTKRELVRRYGISANRINTFGKGKTPGPVDDFMPNRRCDLILFSE